MSCFNQKSIGVITDTSQVSLHKRLQLWAVYRWLDSYKMHLRLVCEKQGDEDALLLPVSYHPYYTHQAFQIGKKRIDVCISIGKELTAAMISQMKERNNIFTKHTKIVAYGLTETKQSVKGKWGRIVNYDTSCFDDVLATSEEYSSVLQAERLEKIPIVLDPMLIIEKMMYEDIAESFEAKDYCLLYLSKASEECLSRGRKASGTAGFRLAVNTRSHDGRPGEILYDDNSLEELLGRIKNAKFIATDSYEIAALALVFGTQFTVLPGGSEQDKCIEFLEHYELNSFYNKFPKNISAPNGARKTALAMARKKLMTERFQSWYLLEDSLQLTKMVDCPTDIRQSECCGCYACKEICPKNAITMVRDEEGFSYPIVDKELCINCGLCKKNCVARENKQISNFEDEYPKVYAAIHNQGNQRKESTSGGVFQSLARYTIEVQKGVVAGVRYDENAKVVADIAQTMEEAKEFSQSKYVKSDIDGIYKRVKSYLEQGRYVLYTGLPCECAALKAYLRNDYERLTICEILCHGGPSPEVFERYIKYVNHHLGAKVKKVVFRDKSKGWKISDMKMTYYFHDREPLSVRARQNNYMNAFLKNYIFRLSCYRCNYTGKNRVGDFLIGDFWGIDAIDESMFDNMGTSAVMIVNKHGEKMWNEIKEQFLLRECTYAEMFRKNHIRPSVMTRERAALFSKLGTVKIDTLLGEFNYTKDNQAKKP